MEGGTSGGYNHQRGKAVTDNDYNDKNTTAATTIMRSCSSCNLGVLRQMITLKKPWKVNGVGRNMQRGTDCLRLVYF